VSHDNTWFLTLEPEPLVAETSTLHLSVYHWGTEVFPIPA